MERRIANGQDGFGVKIKRERVVGYLKIILKFMEILVKKTRFPPSLRQTYTLHTFPAPGLPSEDDVMSVVTWMTARKLIPAGITYDDTVWEGTGTE